MTTNTIDFQELVAIDSLTEVAAKAMRSQDAEKVGRVFHECLLQSVIKRQDAEGVMFGVTEHTLMTVSVNYGDREQRNTAARLAGRMFAAEAVARGETLAVIGSTSVGTAREDGSEVAVTFSQTLLPLHAAKDREQLAEAITELETRMFLDEIQGGRITETVSDGFICLPENQFKALSDEDKQGKTSGSNALLFETFVGSSHSVKLIREGGCKAA